ncbi:L,D-transpeptidase family protein [Marinobacter bohaiensis]|uniref:L,D-transpeptidase family protein n=1 Tax=Marinobacter bohaiensis TaxID=2201898 RepID=UPI0013A6D438|nr:L,D-transpeptidase family protein [Marinobacter bohaiensis]
MEIRLYKNHTRRNGRRWFPAACGLVALLHAATGLALHRVDPDNCEPLPAISPFHASVTELFEQNTDTTVWEGDGELSGLIEALAALEDDGLTPGDYHLDALRHAQQHWQTWGNLGACDRQLASDAYLRALIDLRYGRSFESGGAPMWYSANVSRERDPTLLVATALAGLDDPFSAMAQARPDSERYRNLRKGYRLARRSLPDHWPTIPDGKLLQPGDHGPRVEALRLRLEAAGILPLPPQPGPLRTRYDAELAVAVETFQNSHSLQVDGKVGPQTLDQLNVPPQARLEQIRANLERLRWLARDMESSLVLVDIAAARIEYYEDGERIWQSRTQVGQPGRETPELKSVITHVTVNPHWNIPRSIFLRDALPAIQRDPFYLSDRGIRVYNRAGDELMPSDVDWSHTNNLMLRQDPGPGNALGRVVIRFSNPFAVYLHDTPARGLFGTTNRFYSSGCVRVEDAQTLTRLLFRHASRERRQALALAQASGESHNVHLPRGVYILMAYWTAEADADGRITYRPDVYGSDQPLLAQLDGPSIN